MPAADVRYERYVTCDSVEETERVAAAFAAYLGPGDFVALSGPLGAGKSVMARAIGRVFGVDAPMPSPTYTLLTVHQGRLPIYHMDLYRLGSIDELEFAGLHAYFDSAGICLVEWGERARDVWPPTGWQIRIEMGGNDRREIAIVPFG